MEAVEIAVYIGVAVIVGGIFLSFLVDWDVKETYYGVKDMLFKEEKIGFKKLDSIGFIAELYNIWNDCGLGEVNKTVPLYVEGEGKLTKYFVFAELKKLNYCNSLQSVEYDCGMREDVQMGNISLPTVVNVQCFNNTLIVG